MNPPISAEASETAHVVRERLLASARGLELLSQYERDHLELCSHCQQRLTILSAGVQALQEMVLEGADAATSAQVRFWLTMQAGTEAEVAKFKDWLEDPIRREVAIQMARELAVLGAQLSQVGQQLLEPSGMPHGHPAFQSSGGAITQARSRSPVVSRVGLPWGWTRGHGARAVPVVTLGLVMMLLLARYWLPSAPEADVSSLESKLVAADERSDVSAPLLEVEPVQQDHPEDGSATQSGLGLDTYAARTERYGLILEAGNRGSLICREEEQLRVFIHRSREHWTHLWSISAEGSVLSHSEFAPLDPAEGEYAPAELHLQAPHTPAGWRILAIQMQPGERARPVTELLKRAGIESSSALMVCSSSTKER